jgi:mannosyltransferase
LSIHSARSKPGTAAIPVTLFAITAIGLALRCYRLGQNSFWTDEIASLQTASERFWAIPKAALRQDAFEPPLYFWLLHLIAAAFGDGETALRLLSVIAGALTIPLIWLLVWELSRQRQVALLAAAFLALNPLHLWYSQEARPYALMIFFGTAAFLGLSRALREPSLWRWTTFVVGSSLAMLVHAVGAVIPIIALAWVLLRSDRASTLRPTLLALGANLLLVAPSYVMLAHSIITATGTGSPERPLTGLELPYTALTYLGGYSFGPSVREIQDAGWRVAAAYHLLQLSLAGILIAVWLALVVRRRSSLMTGLLVLCVLPAVLAVTGSAATTKAYNVRYTVLGIIGFVASLSAAIVPLRPRMRNAVAGMFCVVFIWADLQWFFVPRFRKDDSRAAIAWLEARLPPGATVAVAPSYAVGALAHYAERSGAHLCLVGVTTEDDLSRNRVPDALVLTRLYHVDNWKTLETEYGRLSGQSVDRGTEIGFRLLVRAPVRPRIPPSESPSCDTSPQVITTE